MATHSRENRWRPVAWALLLGLGACQAELGATEVLVVVDSDLVVPTQLQSLHVEVYDRHGTDKLRERDFALTNLDGQPAQFTLPLSFGLAADESSSNRDFRLVVTGRGPDAQGAEVDLVQQQQAIASFRPNKSLRLDMFLSQTCYGVCAPTRRRRSVRSPASWASARPCPFMRTCLLLRPSLSVATTS